MTFQESLRDANIHCLYKCSSLLQVSKSIHVKTINDTNSNKQTRFPKHLGSQELFEFMIARNIIDGKLIV